MVDQAALKERDEQRKRRPKFIRHAAHRKPGLAENWRRPRGLHNKLRLNKKSRTTQVTTGHRGPAVVRGLSRKGMKQLLINNHKELLAAEPEVHAIIIAGGLGNKKRLFLLEEAKKQGFTILNLNDKKADEIKASLVDRKTGKAKRLTKQAERDKSIEKKAKDAESKAKADAKAQDEKSPDAEEQKKQELKKQQKILTKKDSSANTQQ